MAGMRGGPPPADTSDKKENMMQRIEEALDAMGICYDIKENAVSLEFWTDTAGQDIPIDIEYDGTAEDFVKKFTEYAENYDVDEEVEMYANIRGKNGVPKSIRTLWNDCQEAKNTLMEIAANIKNALNETDEELKTYYVVFRVNSKYTAAVRARTLEEAKKQGEKEFSEADFGEAEDVDGDISYVEDEDGERLQP